MNKITKGVMSAAFLTVALQNQACAADLYISEYVEGSSYNKALEFYNSSASTVDLAAYEVQYYFNGSNTAGHTINLSGTVVSGAVFVLAHSSADTNILANSNQTTAGSWFNGDDAIVLLKGGVVIDAIGQIGVDPGSEWGTGNTSTKDNTLRRMKSVSVGDDNAYDTFDPSVQWNGFAVNTFDGLGKHDASGGTPPAATSVVINEVDADTLGSDTAEFVELYDGGAGNTDLTGLILVLFNGSNDASYAAYDLDGYKTNSNGYFLLGNSAVTGVNLVIPNGKLQNGADAVALYKASATNFPSSTPVTTTNLLDAVVYDTNDLDDAGLLILLNAGEPQLNEGGMGSKDTHSNQRCANGTGGARNTHGFIQTLATPGQANACGAVTACGSAATLIHTIQGSGATSPENGKAHTVEAVVVADFQDTVSGLSGFFLQEEGADSDTNTSTSEGLFIHDSGFGVNVNKGDRVRVTGTVNEYFGMTEMSGISAIEVCATGGNIQPVDVSLPFANSTFLERYEGMLVNLPQTLTVSENYSLARYGEVMVSSGGRLSIPTNVVLPGSAAAAKQAANDLNRLVVDDGSAVQNPALIPYPAPKLTAFNTVRSGDSVKGINGVIAYSANAYRIHPTVTPLFVASNPRTSAPVLPGTGSLRVASFNVLNYFNGNGQGAGFPTTRGADTASEFTRQRNKIISAIIALNADIIGLMEIENDGYDTNSAIQDLVAGLNAAAVAGSTYAAINPGTAQLGSDQIAVGFIYRTKTVQPLGQAKTLLSYPFDTRNRQPLVQSFREVSSNGKLTVAVNHFKSKGSCPAAGDANADQGDGQGCWNKLRTEAANALVSWLATDPTASGDGDVLIVGDLNSYAKENPITSIESNGYTNLIAKYPATNGYSYVFKGQSGYLDHGLSNVNLTPQVTGTAIWHINADEPRALDYNEEFKTTNQLSELYNADAYRASDHDPVVVELKLIP